MVSLLNTWVNVVILGNLGVQIGLARPTRGLAEFPNA